MKNKNKNKSKKGLEMQLYEKALCSIPRTTKIKILRLDMTDHN